MRACDGDAKVQSVIVLASCHTRVRAPKATVMPTATQAITVDSNLADAFTLLAELDLVEEPVDVVLDTPAVLVEVAAKLEDELEVLPPERVASIEPDVPNTLI